ncbi:putative dipeptides/oligopeptides ABC transporter periplasmic substrate-binding protein [Haloferax elongans ATCC BAA-1513]|uniref:Putative dipeptides/oligopeptides ABC transporter periplasmic substrate-binding protein n=1 Tax=Haloferax elongans ATCC BAA-1513 TaxID=1230453 RepID=M0HXU0_HALEO|nr:putative dipeptides/oligopeptides ABC transporter periplasmic substrate-binding protein [Haloferax elongans ATCC BAA-1513]
MTAVGASAAITGLSGCAIKTTDSGVEVAFGDDDDDSAATQTTGMPMQTTTPGEPTESETTTEPTTQPPTATTTSTETQTTTQKTTAQSTTTAPTTTTTTTAPQRSGGTLQLTSGTLSSFDPIQATDSNSTAVIENLFDGLTTFPNGETTAELQLATDVSISSDSRTYTLSLREDATFHDGSPVTASDIVYSWERLAASDNSRRAYYLLEYLGIEHDTSSDEYVPGSMAVRAVDEHTFRFRLAEPMPAALELLADPAFAPIPEGIVGDIDGYVGRMSYQAFAEGPIGSGPFVFDHWTKNDEVEISRFANYHGTAPDLDGIRWKVISDSTAAYNYGQNRNADFVTVPNDEFDPRKVRISKTDPKGRKFGLYGPMDNGETVSYLSAPLAQSFYIAFNTDNVPKPVRMAMAYALNQQTVVNQVLKGRADPAAHLTPPPIYPNEDYTSHADNKYPYSYDASELDKARQTMEDAGYSASNQYELTLTSYQSPTNKRIGQLLQDSLGSAHIDLKYEETPFSTLLSRGRQGNLDAYFLGWIASYPSPIDFLKNLNPPATQTNGSTDGFYLDWDGTAASADAEAAWQRVEANMESTDQARQIREQAYVTMEEANWDDVALLPLYHPVDERFVYDGVDVAPFGGLGSSHQEYDSAVKGD